MEAIVNSAGEFERRLADKVARFEFASKSTLRLIPTERRVIQEMYV
jgi:hypothetical protein